MNDPSVKGTVFVAVAEEIRTLRESGQITEDQLSVRLEPPDIELLDQKLRPASWYPMSTYARYLDLLCQVEGKGKSEYYEKRGHKSARRLMEAGMYSQLDLLESISHIPRDNESASIEEMLRIYRKRLSVITSLSRSIYNVGQWKVVDDGEHFERVAIEIRDAAAYSDGMVAAIVGFLDECGRSINENYGKLYRFERPEPDHVRIRMLHDLSELRRITRR